MQVLGIDCGFGSLGWAIVEVDENNAVPLGVGCITTEKSSKKQVVKATEDNIRRAQEIYRQLDHLVDCWHPRMIATETMSWPRNAGVVAKMGIAWGVIASVAQEKKLAIVQASPMEIKRAMTGDGKASKERIIAAAQALAPSLVWPHATGKHEHCADAVGAVIACQDSEVMKWARKNL